MLSPVAIMSKTSQERPGNSQAAAAGLTGNDIIAPCTAEGTSPTTPPIATQWNRRRLSASVSTRYLRAARMTAPNMDVIPTASDTHPISASIGPPGHGNAARGPTANWNHMTPNVFAMQIAVPA